jgi:4-amino-4-deoxy-L-arabinose transferase-like glycosyltransferase
LSETAGGNAARFWLAALLALTLLRLAIAGALPLAPDEAYYWLWSRHLQAGYYDHPPLVALFIRAGTLIFGPTPLGVRLLGPLSAAAGTCLLWRAAEDFWPHRQAGLIAALLFNAMLLAGAGAVLMTPDTPLMVCWSAALAGAGRLLFRRDPRWWLAIGGAAGLALLAKYTAVFLVIGFALWLPISKEGRDQLIRRTAWPFAGLGLTLVIFAPNLAWNQAHHWVSYFKQGGRLDQPDPGRALQYLGEFVLGQAGLATPLIFGLLVLGIWRLRRNPGPAGSLLLCLTLPALAVFLEHALFARVQANWPAILYPGACIAAAGLPGPILQRWLQPALALGLALTFLVYAQAATGLLPLPPERDPIALQLAGWKPFCAALAGRKPAFVTSDDYATAAELAFHAPPGMRVAGFGPRWQYLVLPPFGAPGEPGLLITRRRDAACPAPLGTLSRGPQRYRLCAVRAEPGGRLLR